MPSETDLQSALRVTDDARLPRASAAATTNPLKSGYTPPRLRELGDFRCLTLGGSLGVGDSGNAGVQRF